MNEVIPEIPTFVSRLARFSPTSEDGHNIATKAPSMEAKGRARSGKGISYLEIAVACLQPRASRLFSRIPWPHFLVSVPQNGGLDAAFCVPAPPSVATT